MNLGAEKANEAGNYYQWGSVDIPDAYGFGSWEYNGYRTAPDYEGTDKDVATVRLGEGWCTPTVTQWNELINNCTFTQTEVDGVAGYLVTSKLNGNSIFLPGAGYMNYTSLNDSGSIYYMTTHFGMLGTVKILTYSERRQQVMLDEMQGYLGFPVRPVCVRPQEPEVGPLVVDFCVSDSMEAGVGLDGQLSVLCNVGNRPVRKIELSIILPATFFGDNPTVNPELSKAEINCEVVAVNSTTTKFVLTTADGSDFLFPAGDAMTTLFTLDLGCAKYSSNGNYNLTLSDIQFYIDDSTSEQPETDLPIKKVVVVSNNAKFDIETEQEVDLGLSVNWSGYYIGAELPEQVGDYLRWGSISEPENPNDYNPNTYVIPAIDDWCGNPLYDAATARWGEDWFTPTAEQVSELTENCEVVPYVYNGQAGFALTSKINGKTIFFAASGYKQTSGSTTKVYNGTQAVMMLVDRYKTGKISYCMNLVNGNGSVTLNIMNMGRGLMVRPVKRRHQAEPLVVEVDTVGAIDAEKNECGELVICQSGGDKAFNRVVIDLTCDSLLEVDGAEIAADRTDSANTQTTIAHTEDGVSVELKTVDGSDFTVGDTTGKLVTIKFRATKHVAAGLYGVEIRSIDFYNADGVCMAVDSLIIKQIKVVSTATFTVETARDVDMGLSVKWSGVNFGAQTPADHGTLTTPDATLPDIDWGNGWTVPNESHAEELIANCETMPYTYEGTPGYVIRSKNNGKVIFCPANADGVARMLLKNGSVMSVRNGAKTPAIEPAAENEQLFVRPVFSEVVSIREINSEDGQAIIYDLQGRRLAAPVRGLQIINNQKSYKK